jgi:hypothetical protein
MTGHQMGYGLPLIYPMLNNTICYWIDELENERNENINGYKLSLSAVSNFYF